MILCCGEALIDMLPRRISGGEDGYLPVPGGAIFNTAIALGRLEQPAGFFSSLSTDMFGDRLIESLHRSGVATNLCIRSSQPATLAFVKVTGHTAHYYFYDENSAGRSLEISQLPALPEDVMALHFGGISLIAEPCGSAYEKLMADQQHRILSFDPNIRPGFITDEKAYRTRMQRMAAMADIIRVSDEDLDWLATGISGRRLIENWLGGTTRVVLLTKGGDGVTAYTRSGSVHRSAMLVEVVDTIGAGDTFNAGFLAGLHITGLLAREKLERVDSSDLMPALKLATEVAALTVSKPGADPPWASEVSSKIRR